MAPTARRRPSARARRRDEVRDKLVAAIETELAGGGSYTELSVERLVKRADISRSTFYVYFEDKGDVLRASFALIGAELEAAAKPWWALGPGLTKADLRAVLEGIVLAYRPHATLMAAVFDTASYDAVVREEVTAIMTRSIAGLRGHITRGQKEGYVAEGLLPRETATWLIWMSERGQHQLVSAVSDAEVGDWVDAFTDVVWNALYAPARAGRGATPRRRR